jgi:hypothetical protein
MEYDVSCKKKKLNSAKLYKEKKTVMSEVVGAVSHHIQKVRAVAK